MTSPMVMKHHFILGRENLLDMVLGYINPQRVHLQIGFGYYDFDVDPVKIANWEETGARLFKCVGFPTHITRRREEVSIRFARTSLAAVVRQGAVSKLAEYSAPVS